LACSITGPYSSRFFFMGLSEGNRISRRTNDSGWYNQLNKKRMQTDRWRLVVTRRPIISRTNTEMHRSWKPSFRASIEITNWLWKLHFLLIILLYIIIYNLFIPMFIFCSSIRKNDEIEKFQNVIATRKIYITEKNVSDKSYSFFCGNWRSVKENVNSHFKK